MYWATKDKTKRTDRATGVARVGVYDTAEVLLSLVRLMPASLSLLPRRNF